MIIKIFLKWLLTAKTNKLLNLSDLHSVLRTY